MTERIAPLAEGEAPLGDRIGMTPEELRVAIAELESEGEPVPDERRWALAGHDEES